VYSCLKKILVLFYLITFSQKCFALSVAAVTAKLGQILPNKIYIISVLLH